MLIRRGLSIAALAFAVVLGACATTTLKEHWRDPEYRPAPEQRALVIAVTGRDDRRRIFEEEFAKRLRQEGIDAVPSYPQLSIAGPKDLDAVRAAVQRNNATMVVSVRLLQLDERTAVSGGHYGPTGFYSYYPGSWAGVQYYSPPSVYQYRTYTTETRVFDMKRDKLVWAATLQSEEPSDFKAAAAEYVDLVVKQMRDNKLLKGG